MKESGASVGLASPRQADYRNLQWKSNNIGAKLLGKMGWKDGQAVGKRQRVDAASTTTSSGDGGGGQGGKHVSSEGLRVAKRAEGLGVGAERTRQASIHGSTDVHRDFATVLARLNSQRGSEDGDSSSSSRRKRREKKRKKKESKKESKSISLPTNKTTCRKVRHAKFQEKTEEDMKCIFGSASLGFSPPAAVVSDQSSSSGGVVGGSSERKKKSKRKSSGGEAEPRKKKKQKL
jgi:hypothetical protein